MYRQPQLVLVDDDPDYRYLVEAAMQECMPACGLKVFYKGADLLSWLAGNPRPGMILLDIHMPGLTGFDILHRLKSADPYKAIPVIMLSTSGAQQDVEASIRHGANAYITKPRTYLDLVTHLAVFSQYWFDLARQVEMPWLQSDSYFRRN